MTNKENGNDIDQMLINNILFGNCETVKKIIDEGIEINALIHIDGSALHLAAAMGKANIINLLIDSGADVNIKNNDDKTPLYSAFKRLNKEAIKVLIKRGADYSTSDKFRKEILGDVPFFLKDDAKRLLIELENLKSENS